jgi:hypothetical protein
MKLLHIGLISTNSLFSSPIEIDSYFSSMERNEARFEIWIVWEEVEEDSKVEDICYGTTHNSFSLCLVVVYSGDILSSDFVLIVSEHRSFSLS